jgi:O-methyltransferase
VTRSLVDRLSNTWIDRLISRFYAGFEIAVMSVFNGSARVALLKEIRKEDAILLCRPSELIIVHSLAVGQVGVSGDYAEVGVYKGTTAKLICEAKGDKHLHLFDTFDGLPSKTDIDVRFTENMFVASVEAVRKRLAKYDNVHIYQGLFPETASPIKDRRFAFVHIDVDIYQSTKDCLEFFYERMTPGGVILSHDYPSSAGVKKAFDDFLVDKQENIINLPLSQGMIVKLV